MRIALINRSIALINSHLRSAGYAILNNDIIGSFISENERSVRFLLRLRSAQEKPNRSWSCTTYLFLTVANFHLYASLGANPNSSLNALPKQEGH